MDDVLAVQVLQGLADAAGDRQGVLARACAPRSAAPAAASAPAGTPSRCRAGSSPPPARCAGCTDGRSVLPIASSRWKREKKAGSLSNCMNGTLIATGWPLCRSWALKIDAMPLRLMRSVMLEPLVQDLADFDFMAHGQLAALDRSVVRDRTSRLRRGRSARSAPRDYRRCRASPPAPPAGGRPPRARRGVTISAISSSGTQWCMPSEHCTR